MTAPSAGPLDPDGLYHLATRHEWDEARRRGTIAPHSLAAEGFVHCSWGRQVPGTLARHFGGATDVLALRLDPERLGGIPLVEEDSYRSGQAFPHIYGEVPVAVVVAIVPVPAGESPSG